MKQVKLLLIMLLGLFPYVLLGKEIYPRETALINSGWKYYQGDCLGAEQPGFDDGSWENVGIPHSFSIPYFMSQDFYVGYGWYRKKLNLNSKDVKRKLFLEFEGVFQEAEVYVNGEKTGSHRGGYTGFSIDITAAARIGENVIAVRVNNLWRPNVAPRAGEHVFSGGIYRNVKLVKKERTHIAWCGTFVTTPDLGKQNGESSTVRVETEVYNDSEDSGEYKLRTIIANMEGNEVAVVESKEQIATQCSKKWVQQTKSIQKPLLWSPNTPHLYKAISKLYKDGELIDYTETPFGFRWFEWTADKGFFLNGEHFIIRGANVHQDQAGWGDAVTESAMRRDVKMMKEAGFNLIRGSHYPHAPAFSQACDEEGVLFWSEAPFWGIGGFRQDGYWNSSAYPVNKKDETQFEESALKQLEEMIRIHRNHPAIVAWSMCNEAFFSADEAMPRVRRLLKRMVELSHKLDATRPAAIGGAQRPLGNERIDRIGDIAGYNGDGATQPDFQNPGIPNIVSEYGSVTADRPGEYAPGWGDLQRENGWKGRIWRSGQAIWCGFDHGSIAGSALGKMGIVDYFRIPKRSWYWYRHEYMGVNPPEWPIDEKGTALKLEASKTKRIKTDGTDDVQLLVKVQNADGQTVCHSPVVKLTVVAGPGEFPTGRSIVFAPDSDIRIMDGQAAISFRSYYAGKCIVEASSPGLQTARMEMEFVGKHKYKEGKTPIVKERTYVRFVREKKEKEVAAFGRNNPTFASSHQEKHTPGMAADGNRQTYWQAADTDTTPNWVLDTEKKLVLKTIQISIPQGAPASCFIELSDDKENWIKVSEKVRTNVAGQEMTWDFGNMEQSGRFVRICFNGNERAALSEVVVKGIVKE